GQEIRLRDIASVSKGFEKSTTIHKSQGHEAIVLHIQKNADTDILSAQRAVMQFIRKFQAENPDTPVGIATLDDESYDVRNRLSLIGTNGLAGFILIIIILFLFLDFRSGFWVALGIPFTLAFALILSYMFGYTVNNMTLAAVIIVLGIVVDDAIIVAENVARLKREGVPPRQAAVDGTIAVIRPIIASILTTCAAFLPLYFYSGWFGQLVVIIPTIIFFMLFGSFLESSFILPAHLSHKPATWGWLRHLEHSPFTHARDRLMHRFVEWYRDSIQILFRFRLVIIFGFILLLAGASALFVMKMSFVMFPREESREIAVQVKGGDDLNRIEMARLTGKLERMFLEDPHGVVLAHITRIGQSRHGGEALENEAFLRVELLPPSERDVSLNRLFREWVPKAEAIEGFTEVRFMRSRWGSDSGSPIEIEIRENDDEARTEVVNRLARGMEDHPDLVNIEIEEPVIRNEYRLQLKRSELSRLGVNPSQLGSAVRVFVEGDILYTLFRGNEEVDVRLTSDIENKRELENVLDLKIENQGAYLIPLRSLVDVIQDKKPSSIERTNFKRTSKIFAGIKPESGRTPLEIADELEDTLFPRVTKGHPNTVLQFRGEIEDSRESGKDFIFSIYLVLIIIYVLLVILFNSLKTPLLIASVIPFGVVGVIFSFIAHGMSQYGFFAVIGTLGMIGVVVNNAILMISRLENAPLLEDNTRSGIFSFTASISSTRLRPVLLTTMTTVAGLLPTAYGWGGYDSMLAEMMLALCWGLIFSTLVTLILIPCLYTYYREFQTRIRTDTAK
ncbi:MAG: efflux RND transporter permease subunit, partial [Spirochaetota bacterium]